MKKLMNHKKFILVLGLLLALTICVPGTLGYLVAKTDTFINTFTPFKSLMGDVIISKSVEHPFGDDYEIPDTISFDFRVDLGSFYANSTVKTSKGDITADKDGGFTVALKPGESLGLKDIDENTKVTVTELATELPGFSAVGETAREVIVPADGYAEVAFVNQYTPASTTLNAELRVTKKIAGRVWLDTDTFDFTFASTKTSGENVWSILDTKTADIDHQTVSFNDTLSKITYSEVGTYKYRIAEVKGDIPNMSYDVTPQYITVTVTDKDMDGSLEVDQITTTLGAVVNYDESKDIFVVESLITNVFEGPSLNTEDHYGYIIGYPVDYRTGAPTEDESLWPVKPDGDITRAEAATIFFRLLSDESRAQYWSKTNVYVDVTANDWFNNAVSTLSNAGILNGYPDGTFLPNEPITRAEFTVIAERFFKSEYTGTDDYFTDISDHWARESINAAYEDGIVSGFPDNTFRPDLNITRAEAVAIVNRTVGRKPHKDHLHPDMRVWPDNADPSIWYYADIQEATNSHDYHMVGEGAAVYEEWLNILPMRDWAALEREWSDAYDGSDGNDVIE